MLAKKNKEIDFKAKLVIEDTSILVNILNVFGKHNYAVRLVLDKDFAYSCMYSTDQSCAITLNMKDSMFKEYSIKEKVNIDVNVDEFTRVLKAMKNNVSIIVTNDYMLKLSSENGINKSVDISMVTIEEDKLNPPIENMEFISSVSLNLEKFREILSDIKTLNISTGMMMKLDSTGFYIINDSNQSMISAYNVWLSKPDVFKVLQKAKEKIMAKISSDYISDFLTKVSLSEMFEIHFMGNDCPVKFVQNDDKIKLVLLVSPMVDTEQELPDKGEEIVEETKEEQIDAEENIVE